MAGDIVPVVRCSAQVSFLTLQPFNTASHLVVTPTTSLSLLCNCDFPTVGILM